MMEELVGVLGFYALQPGWCERVSEKSDSAQSCYGSQ